MKPSITALFLSAIFGGFVAAAIVLATTNRAPMRTRPSLADTGPASPAIPEPKALHQDLSQPSTARAETRALFDELDRRLGELELSANTSSRQSLNDSNLTIQVETLTARVEALEEALRNGTALQVPKEVLAETLAEVRKDEIVEKVEAYQEKRAARLEDDLVKMQDWLELDAYQTDEMRVALQLQYDRELEQTRIWKETGDDEAAGELKRADGELFAEDLSRFLTPEQSETFWTEVLGGGGKGSGK